MIIRLEMQGQVHKYRRFLFSRKGSTDFALSTWQVYELIMCFVAQLQLDLQRVLPPRSNAKCLDIVSFIEKI